MAVQGSLKSLRIPELFSLLHQLRKTGILMLISESDERTFVFHRGNLVFANTRDGSRQIGSILVRLGILTPESLEEIQKAPAGAGNYFGQKLIDSERVSPDDITRAVREQILDIMEEVLKWKVGAFHFDEDELPFAIPEGNPVSTHSVILEATSRSDERIHVQEFFPELEAILARSKEEQGAPRDQDAVATLAMVDGKRTVEQILYSSPLGHQATAALLYDLVRRGLIQQAGLQPVKVDARPLQEIRCLPVAPELPGKLFSAFGQDGYQRSRVCEIVSHDPVLAVKVLREGMSMNPATSGASIGIEQLVDDLGRFQLRSLLIPEAVRGLFFPKAQCHWHACWKFATFCGHLCREIAIAVEYPYPEEAHLAGLIHDLGVYILLNRDPATYQQLARESLENRRDVETLEQEAFRVSHTSLGGTYAEKWSFPPAVSLAIRGHHEPQTIPSSQLLHIIAVAEGLAREKGFTIGFSPGANQQFKASLKALRLNHKRVLSLAARQPRRGLLVSV